MDKRTYITVFLSFLFSNKYSHTNRILPTLSLQQKHQNKKALWAFPLFYLTDITNMGSKFFWIRWRGWSGQPMAYFCVQLRAVASYLALSVLYMWAISGTSGSSGFGSVNREHIDKRTYWKKRKLLWQISFTTTKCKSTQATPKYSLTLLKL